MVEKANPVTATLPVLPECVEALQTKCELTFGPGEALSLPLEILASAPLHFGEAFLAPSQVIGPLGKSPFSFGQHPLDFLQTPLDAGIEMVQTLQHERISLDDDRNS
jgi:hypothetical protein